MCRNVLRPKCLRSEVSVHRFNDTSTQMFIPARIICSLVCAKIDFRLARLNSTSTTNLFCHHDHGRIITCIHGTIRRQTTEFVINCFQNFSFRALYVIPIFRHILSEHLFVNQSARPRTTGGVRRPGGDLYPPTATLSPIARFADYSQLDDSQFQYTTFAAITYSKFLHKTFRRVH